jgi:hypothetical protein
MGQMVWQSRYPVHSNRLGHFAKPTAKALRSFETSGSTISPNSTTSRKTGAWRTRLRLPHVPSLPFTITRMTTTPVQASQVRFQVLTALTIKTVVFWNVTPYSLPEICWRFRLPWCIHLYLLLSFITSMLLYLSYIPHHLALQPFVSLGLLCYSPTQVSILLDFPSPSFNPHPSQVFLDIIYLSYIRLHLL